LSNAVARLAAVLVVVGAVAIAVVRFAAIDATSHSASDTFRPWLIQVAVIAVVAVTAARAIAALQRRSGGGR
jgi:hypothetical protein